MLAAGVDGSRKGWLCIVRDLESGALRSRAYVTARELFLQDPSPMVVALDIPIGLLDAGSRLCDAEARRVLGPRASSVFSAPLRPMLRARSWEEACQIRDGIEYKRITKQAWGILPKIREIAPAASWPAEPEAQAEIRRDFQEPYGDRRQELVLIGIGMNEAALRAGFDRCLLTDAELRLGAESWRAFANPFPAWGQVSVEADAAQVA